MEERKKKKGAESLARTKKKRKTLRKHVKTNYNDLPAGTRLTATMNTVKPYAHS